LFAKGSSPWRCGHHALSSIWEQVAKLVLACRWQPHITGL
jgi:hypothetical protein